MILPRGIAHVSFSGGGVFLPARNPSDRQSLIANVALRARTNDLVQVLIDDQRWIVRTLRDQYVAGCDRCGLALEPACYSAADDRSAYCVTCIFANDTQPTPPAPGAAQEPDR